MSAQSADDQHPTATVAKDAGTSAVMPLAFDVAASAVKQVAVTAELGVSLVDSFGLLNHRFPVALRMNGRDGVDARINGRHVPIS